jgi:hypothetical protein
MRHAFIVSVVISLALTACLKLVSALGHAESLNLPESLSGWSIRMLFLVGAAFEVLLMLLLVSRCSETTKALAIIAFACVLLLFRACRLLIGASDPCPCMGDIFSNARLRSSIVAPLTYFLLLYWLTGGLLLIKLRDVTGDSNPERDAAGK